MVMATRENASRQTAERLGAEIQRRMALMGMTYEELSLETRIVRSRLHRIATGDRLQWADPDELEAIADALDTTVSELLRAAGYPLTAA